MPSWLGRIFGFGTKNLPKQIKKADTVQKVLSEVKTEVGTKVAQATKPSVPSMGSKLDYGKWYYGIDTKAILASIGVMSVVLGLALQDMIL